MLKLSHCDVLACTVDCSKAFSPNFFMRPLNLTLVDSNDISSKNASYTSSVIQSVAIVCSSIIAPHHPCRHH